MNIPEKIMNAIVKNNGFLDVTKFKEFDEVLIIHVEGGSFDEEALEALIDIPFFRGLHSFQKNIISIVFDKECEIDGKMIKIEDY